MKSTEQIIEAWKNPKSRNDVELVHPSGKGFHELEVQEMHFVAGGSTAEPQWTPATVSSIPCVRVATVVSGAAASAVVSFVASAVADCD